MKGKRVLPPRQPSSTKASGSPHGQSTSTAGAAPNRAPSLTRKPNSNSSRYKNGSNYQKKNNGGSPNSNSSHRKRYWKEAVTATIGSGIATAVAAAMGGNSSGDFNNVFGEEKPSFAVGEGSDTGRRPLRRRLEVARRRFRVAVTGTTRAARSQ
ncbi:hypothetical protein DEO72_LG7g2173 [Vigna unguiculata]|uniref:Uncharacterized protein n=1 Tax=Vigna unguiculata TaxID=3917 RepID=A0A4D6MJT6_VIGUN|nr:hypothetical protein DEO72_LG7g2173 [Vigna unguiculata]